MKKLLTSLLTASLLTLGATAAFAETAPKSVIHVVSVKWKAEATPAQIKAALDGVQALPAANSGITHVWTKAIKVQGEWSTIFVMEFANEAALKAYAGSAARKSGTRPTCPFATTAIRTISPTDIGPSALTKDRSRAVFFASSLIGLTELPPPTPGKSAAKISALGRQS